ncbi:iron-containing alcohol dehydrogenase, partial [Burkholderia cenocepacia]|nr:iron-containing alcohol dehydrogenase [Burkholderia cenocepacia]
TVSLPPKYPAASGVNAMAHAVEALYAEDANPVISLMAEAGAGEPRAIQRAAAHCAILRIAHHDGQCFAERANRLLGHQAD